MITLFRNLKTAAKLIMAFALMAINVGGVGIIGMSKVSQLNGFIQTMYNDRLVPAIDLGHMIENINNVKGSGLLKSRFFKSVLQTPLVNELFVGRGVIYKPVFVNLSRR